MTPLRQEVGETWGEPLIPPGPARPSLQAMTETGGTTFAAECYWPGVGQDDLSELDRRVHDCVGQLAGEGRAVRYLGAMLMVEDEVVLCLFEGSLEDVRRAAEDAAIPFERILRSAPSPWWQRVERLPSVSVDGVGAAGAAEREREGIR
jgi:hypothetical protein